MENKQEKLININEIFGAVIQGEGKFQGTLCAFIRTNGCNLRCQWKNNDGSVSNCDTPYTSWNPEKANMQTSTQIVHTLEGLLLGTKSEVQHVVISGGEPYMQPGIVELVDLLHEKGYVTTIETNGTIYKNTNVDLISLSPKLDSSTPIADSRERTIHMTNRKYEESISQFIEEAVADDKHIQFKFVYNEPRDIAEIKVFCDKYNISNTEVWLMPQGATLDLQLKNMKNTMDVAVKNNYNFSGRLHVLAYSDKRGV